MLGDRRIAFIGGGHIAEIIVRRLTESQALAGGQIVVSDPKPARRAHLADRFGVVPSESNVDAARTGDLVLLCVRPEVVEAILPDLRAARLRPDQTVISIAAGVPLSAYESLGNQQPLVRALPNPPSQVGQGISPLIFSPAVTSEQRALTMALFGALGEVVEVEESHLDAITSLSSPVATYLFFRSLIDAGEACGLPLPIATQIAAQTLVGSMAVWQAQQVDPDALIEEASTPGGVSVESLRVLRGGEFESAISDAIVRGTARASELGGSSTDSE